MATKKSKLKKTKATAATGTATANPRAQAGAPDPSALSIGDLSVIALFGNQNFQTLPWLMYQFMSSYKMKEAAVISLSLLLICYTFFYFFDRIFKIENA